MGIWQSDAHAAFGGSIFSIGFERRPPYSPPQLPPGARLETVLGPAYDQLHSIKGIEQEKKTLRYDRF